MRTFCNILWHFPSLGFIRAFGNLIVGCLFCLTIILIPVGLGFFQLAKFQLSPFNNMLVSRKEFAGAVGEEYKLNPAMAVLNVIARIIYFIPGCIAAVGILATAVGEFVTIIGIPAGITDCRSIGFMFNPVNKVCVTRDLESKIQQARTLRAERYYQKDEPNVSVTVSEVCVEEGAVNN